MTYDAKVIQVMLASPGDVKAERQAFLRVVAEWNSINSFSTSTILLPRTWELDVAPELGQHPQSLINNRILNNSDLLVATFWQRVGTPTKKAQGGAIEEVQLHLKRKKPILLYFSNAPSSPSEIDISQLEKLREFKKWAQDKGMYRGYETLAQFSADLLRNLHQALEQNGLLLRTTKPDRSQTPLVGLKKFPRDFLSSLGRSGKRRAVIRKDGSSFVIEIGGIAMFESNKSEEYTKWIDSLVSLIGRGFLRDATGRGEVFELTDAGRILAEAE